MIVPVAKRAPSSAMKIRRISATSIESKMPTAPWAKKSSPIVEILAVPVRPKMQVDDRRGEKQRCPGDQEGARHRPRPPPPRPDHPSRARNRLSRPGTRELPRTRRRLPVPGADDLSRADTAIEAHISPKRTIGSFTC